MFEQHTWENVLQRLLTRFKQPGVAKQEGSFVYDALSPAAIEIAQSYADLDRVLELGFAQTSADEYLDLRAAEYGLARKPPVAATGEVTVYGDKGAVVPKGAMFATRSGTLFRSVEQSVVPADGRAVVRVVAVETGTGGNVLTGMIDSILGDMSGIARVTNEQPTQGGYDGETDGSLLERLLAKVRKPATSGNAHEYRQWALEVPGIAEARVFPLRHGNGTVEVVLLDEERRAPAASLVSEVADYIEKMRPIGASVTVKAAEEVPIDVEVEVVLTQDASLEAVREAIEEGMRGYLKTLAFLDPVVRYTRIANLILDTPSVVDYQGLSVNGRTSGNIDIPADGVAVVGTVTCHEA